MKITQYQVYVACLDPSLGSEMKKTRPIVVISPQAMNNNLNTVVMCPITTTLHPQWKSRVACLQGEIAVDQIRCIDKQRLVKKLEPLTAEQISEVRQIIRDLYG